MKLTLFLGGLDGEPLSLEFSKDEPDVRLPVGPLHKEVPGDPEEVLWDPEEVPGDSKEVPEVGLDDLLQL